MRFFLICSILLLSYVFVAAQTEQAPILEKELRYNDWTYQNIVDGKNVNLRKFSKDKKLVLVVYFAPWCGNWKHEAPFVEKMFEKYKSNGFSVIAVGEYDTVDAMKIHLDFYKYTFPIVFESTSREDKQKTTHYTYRKEVGDTRNWGSPFNIFLSPSSLPKEGDPLTTKASVVSGELIEPEAENFIRTKLGLKPLDLKAETSKKEIEACSEDKKTVEFKKP